MTSLFVSHRPGGGRPIVFLHGLASSGEQDWPVAEWSTALGDRPAVVVDLPAHGKSAGVGALSTSGVLDLLASAVVDSVGSAEVDMVGYSLGARLIWDLASHPMLRVRRLVLGGLAPGEPFASVDLVAARSALAGAGAPNDQLTGMILHLASLPGNRPDDILDLVQGLASEPFDPAGGAPTQPVLLVGGSADRMVAGIDGLAAHLREARVAVVPGDHLEALHSAEFRRAVGEFLLD